MIELVEGFWVDPWEVKIIRKISESKCPLYVTGEGYLDGHVLDYPAEEVVEAIIDARNDSEDDDEED